MCFIACCKLFVGAEKCGHVALKFVNLCALDWFLEQVRASFGSL